MSPDVNTPDAPRSVQWPIEMLRALIDDGVPSRLGADAFILACVLVSTQDRVGRKSIGYWRDQLCKLCGFPTSNTERLRAARKALEKDRWLEFTSPKNGERGQTFYVMQTKSPERNPSFDRGENGSGDSQTDSIDPGESRSAKQLTRNESRSGDDVTRAKPVVKPERNPSSDPGETRTPSLPSISIPISSFPNTKNPLTPKGEVDFVETPEVVETLEEKIKVSLVRAQRQPRPDPVAEIPLPAALDSVTFGDAWSLWQQHRREIKKPLTPTQAQATIRKLEGLGVDRAVAAIEHSVANGWQGIFEPDTRGGKNDMFSGINSFLKGSDPTKIRTGNTAAVIAEARAKATANRFGPGQLYDPNDRTPRTF